MSDNKNKEYYLMIDNYVFEDMKHEVVEALLNETKK